MKYKISMLIIFLISIIFIPKVNAHFSDLPLLGKTIYLDAGQPRYF